MGRSPPRSARPPHQAHAAISRFQAMVLYYQVNYALGPVPADAAYFHAQFRRENPLRTKGTYTILDGVQGKGQYVGTYLAVGVHNTGWWGEGEVKFYLDGDKDFPTRDQLEWH